MHDAELTPGDIVEALINETTALAFWEWWVKKCVSLNLYHYLLKITLRVGVPTDHRHDNHTHRNTEVKAVMICVAVEMAETLVDYSVDASTRVDVPSCFKWSNMQSSTAEKNKQLQRCLRFLLLRQSSVEGQRRANRAKQKLLSQPHMQLFI